jgi:pimeloyl-ACP methyl ester carboxylesterase
VPTVEARGLRFHTQQLGRAGTPVVMLHGLFTGSLASWWFTAAPALGRAHTVRLLDLRGHGLSDCPPDGYDTATMVDDVLALTDDLDALLEEEHLDQASPEEGVVVDDQDADGVGGRRLLAGFERGHAGWSPWGRFTPSR